MLKILDRIIGIISAIILIVSIFYRADNDPLLFFVIVIFSYATVRLLMK